MCSSQNHDNIAPGVENSLNEERLAAMNSVIPLTFPHRAPAFINTCVITPIQLDLSWTTHIGTSVDFKREGPNTYTTSWLHGNSSKHSEFRNIIPCLKSTHLTTPNIDTSRKRRNCNWSSLQEKFNSRIRESWQLNRVIPYGFLLIFELDISSYDNREGRKKISSWQLDEGET